VHYLQLNCTQHKSYSALVIMHVHGIGQSHWPVQIYVRFWSFVNVDEHRVTHFLVFGCDSCCPHDSEKHVDGVSHIKRKHFEDPICYIWSQIPGIFNELKHSWNPHLPSIESRSHVRFFKPWFSALVTGVSSLNLSKLPS